MDKLQKTKLAKKRKQIVETAKSLFSQFGAKRITIEEICEKTHVSKATFYKYFPNKVELVRSIKSELVDIGFAKFDEISELDISYPEKIKLMTRWKMEYFDKMNHEFIREMLDTDDVANEYKRRYLKNITNAQAQGEIRPDLHPELIWIVSQKLFELIKDGSWKETFSDYKDFQKQIRTLVFFGLLTRPEN